MSRVYDIEGIAPCINTMQGGYSNTITTVEKDNYVLILPDKASNEKRYDPL